MMVLWIFWVKIFFKRLFYLIKSSPALIVWLMIIIGAFVFAFTNNYINISMDIQTIIMVIMLLTLFSLLNSLKNYNVMPILIKYSKSRNNNKNIKIKFFIKQAVKNNMLLLVFSIIIYITILNIHYFPIIIGTAIFSIILSFSLMYIKHNCINNKVKKYNQRTVKINPIIKSILYDYLSPNFLVMAVLCFTLTFMVIIEYSGDINILNETNNQTVFFILFTVIISIGFMGIIESVPNINWKFWAIVCSKKYSYYIKRTILFLISVFSSLLITFIFMGSIINIPLLLKHLYSIAIVLFVTVNTAYTVSHILIKGIILFAFITLTVWISTLPVIYITLLLIPAFFIMIKAKNEYKEWYLL